MPPYQKSLFIFRRDLRLEDNLGLIHSLKNSQSVIPAFIFDPRQVTENPYKGDASLQFMLESLDDLSEQLQTAGGRLYFFCGKPEDIVAKLINEEEIQAVFVNRDYTPFSQHRDQNIKKICETNGVIFQAIGDALLHEPEAIKKSDGTPYTVFTPFMRRCLQEPVRKPTNNSGNHYYKKTIKLEQPHATEKVLKNKNCNLAAKGGRTKALRILKNIKSFVNYDEERNIPSLSKTTYLSAHNKFGTCSIREVYHAICKAFGPEHSLIREIYWRDFFTHIGFHFPHVLGASFHKKYDQLAWDHNPQNFKAWCDGQTGFPIVDAGMRELNATGFMHNRVRMVVASFLIKDLHIDYRQGERYFAQRLVDYDPLVNNGNWQWAASTGCDAQPYFRIFNPWLQQEKFDPQCVYIKRWIPELKSSPAKVIHAWHKGSDLLTINYPNPIIDHKTESQRAIARYEHIRKH